MSCLLTLVEAVPASVATVSSPILTVMFLAVESDVQLTMTTAPTLRLAATGARVNVVAAERLPSLTMVLSLLMATLAAFADTVGLTASAVGKMAFTFLFVSPGMFGASKL